MLSENGRPEIFAKNGECPAETEGLESLHYIQLTGEELPRKSVTNYVFCPWAQKTVSADN